MLREVHCWSAVKYNCLRKQQKNEALSIQQKSLSIGPTFVCSSNLQFTKELDSVQGMLMLQTLLSVYYFFLMWQKTCSLWITVIQHDKNFMHDVNVLLKKTSVLVFCLDAKGYCCFFKHNKR